MHARLSFLSALAALAVAGLPAVAQPPQDRPWAFLSGNPSEPAEQAPADAIRTITLRPNTEEPLYLYVRNPTDEARTVTVVLASGGGAGDAVGRASVTAPAKQTVRVAVGPAHAPPPPVR